jgi:hypothetical protein
METQPQTNQGANEMTSTMSTQLVRGRKGLTIVLAPSARIELAHIINAGLKQHTLAGVAETSTLSPETIITRSHDTGRSASGERMSLWSFIGLCDGLHLDPYTVAKSVGVEIQDEDIRRAKDALELRRMRQAKQNPQPRATFQHTDAPGKFADVLTANVALRLEARIEEMVQAKVEAALLELLGTV